MAKLADAQVSGSCGRPWGFKSLRPHQKRRPVKGRFFGNKRVIRRGLRVEARARASGLRVKLVKTEHGAQTTSALWAVYRGAPPKAQVPSSAPKSRRRFYSGGFLITAADMSIPCDRYDCMNKRSMIKYDFVKNNVVVGFIYQIKSIVFFGVSQYFCVKPYFRVIIRIR